MKTTLLRWWRAYWQASKPARTVYLPFRSEEGRS